MSSRGQRGFTMVEVSIASTVFSIVLLVALTTFFAVGHLFYKGISITQTQDVITQIYQDLSGNFQNAGSVSPKLASQSGYSYYCIGNSRYTYKINNLVNLDNSPNHAANGNFGLLKDILPGNNSACAEPCNDLGGNCPAGTAKFNKPVELLGQQMRLERFDITSGGGDLYDLNIIVAYGEDDVLAYSSTTTPPDYSTVACKDDSRTQQFCSINTLNTSIHRGLGF